MTNNLIPSHHYQSWELSAENMAANWVSTQQLQENINLIENLLLTSGPDYEDRPFYEQMLNEQYEELRIIQESNAAANTRLPDSYTNLAPYRPAEPASPASSSGASRKRSLGQNATYPDSKRPSVNPSPLTPNTPNSVYSDPPGYRPTAPFRAPAMAGPSRQQTLPYVSSRPTQSNVIDLTDSNPPTPDPFPELNNAFVDGGGAPQPIDAFTQNFMPEHEFAQFLMQPSSAGTGYAFQQPLPVPQPVAGLAYDAYGAPEVPLYVGNADKPWAPLDNEDEYGTPLSYDEAQAVENLLGNVSAHDAEDAPERREQTPRMMCSQLKEYQKIGLTWLIKVIHVFSTSLLFLLTFSADGDRHQQRWYFGRWNGSWKDRTGYISYLCSTINRSGVQDYPNRCARCSDATVGEGD